MQVTDQGIIDEINRLRPDMERIANSRVEKGWSRDESDWPARTIINLYEDTRKNNNKEDSIAFVEALRYEWRVQLNKAFAGKR